MFKMVALSAGCLDGIFCTYAAFSNIYKKNQIQCEDFCLNGANFKPRPLELTNLNNSQLFSHQFGLFKIVNLLKVRK